MCFITRPKIKAAKVAKSNIIAFKLMKNIGISTAYSPFRDKVWQIGHPVSARLKTPLSYAGEEINEGLHCFKTAGDARRYASREKHHKLVPVMIPQGAEYYENDNQIVSNQMILLGTDLRIFKAVVKKLSK